MRRTARARAIFERLAAAYPDPQTELTYGNPFELLVAVVLSAQCTDKRVNLTTPALFARYPTPQALAAATYEDLFDIIKSISFPGNKTRHLLGMAGLLLERHGGQVPDDLDALTALPGVGRKTANVILSVVWERPAMAVDTHVFRVSNRTGLTQAKNPLQSERQLMEVIPEPMVHKAHHWLILHGRYTCLARRPRCEACPITDLCKYYQTLVRAGQAPGPPPNGQPA